MTVRFEPVPTYDIPSKWDIIPVHASDRGAFKYCRRQWAWSSPMMRNLVPKAEVHGVRENLWFGAGIHYALERYYQPLREDPEVTFETWFNLEWSGGLVAGDELQHYTDRQPEPVLSNYNAYRIRGLDELLPAPDYDRFMELLDLGKGMMRYYKEYAEANDDFTVIATEHDFSVPILNSDGNALYMIDKRDMPSDWEPNAKENVFGPLMYEDQIEDEHGLLDVLYKQCHARGRMDLILREHEHGRYGIKDYKTASRVDEDYFRHLDLDEQCTTYLTLGEVEAKVYDLPYKVLEFIQYEALLKGYPKPPTILRSGMPSLNRQTEYTTAEMFATVIKSNPVWESVFNHDEKMQSYYEWLVETEDTRFINRKEKWRNQAQRQNARIRLYYESIDMLSDPVLYPTPRKEYGCLNCAFRTPCLQAEDGSDYLSTLEMGYEPNFDR